MRLDIANEMNDEKKTTLSRRWDDVGAAAVCVSSHCRREKRVRKGTMYWTVDTAKKSSESISNIQYQYVVIYLTMLV